MTETTAADDREELAAYVAGQPAWTDRWNKLMGM